MQGLIHSFSQRCFGYKAAYSFFLIQRAGKARSGGQATRLFPSMCARRSREMGGTIQFWMGPSGKRALTSSKPNTTQSTCHLKGRVLCRHHPAATPRNLRRILFLPDEEARFDFSSDQLREQHSELPLLDNEQVREFCSVQANHANNSRMVLYCYETVRIVPASKVAKQG